MTEAEWLGCIDPAKVLAFLQGKVSDRRIWLLVSACWRRSTRYSDTVRLRLVEITDRLADGEATYHELAVALTPFFPIREESYDDTDPVEASQEFAQNPWNPAWGTAYDMSSRVERRVYFSMIYEVFGNPFRPVILNPAWLTPTATKLAQTIYKDRAFDCLPILADALEDAGCDNADILRHCRGPGAHVRGCWVIDLLLGKE
jgi:hypothetical protein